MIPRRFSSTAPFAGAGGHKRGHICATRWPVIWSLRLVALAGLRGATTSRMAVEVEVDPAIRYLVTDQEIPRGVGGWGAAPTDDGWP